MKNGENLGLPRLRAYSISFAVVFSLIQQSIRGLNIFYKYSNSQKTPHKIEIPLKIQPPEELVKEPVTLGDHLRRRRLALGLYQKGCPPFRVGVHRLQQSRNVGKMTRWSSITLSYMPKVIEFLGYNPIPCPEVLLERLAWYKQVKGLTLEQLGAEMERDPEQLADWLAGRHKPSRNNQEKMELFLAGKF